MYIIYGESPHLFMVWVIGSLFQLYDLGEPLLCFGPFSHLHVALTKVEPVWSEGVRVGSVGSLKVANGFLVARRGDGTNETGSLPLQPR